MKPPAWKYSALIAWLLVSGCLGGTPSWAPLQGAPFCPVMAGDTRDNAEPQAVILLPNHQITPEQLVVVGLRDSVVTRALAPLPAEAPTGCGANTRCRVAAPLISAPRNPVLAVFTPQISAPLPEPPSVAVSLAERAQWRLEELAWAVADTHPPAGATPLDPQSTRLRGLIKVRREHAPPLLAAVGEAGCLGLVSVLDHQADENLSWDAFALPAPCAPLAALPVTDLDGDGLLDLAVYAGHDPQTQVFRGVYTLTPSVADEGKGRPRDQNQLSTALQRRWGGVFQACGTPAP